MTTTTIPTSNGPTNPLVGALLTDLYQLTMTYAHWRIGKADDPAVFELFFRKNPFGGEYTIFCGLDECLKLLETFQFRDDDIAYLKSTPALKDCEDGFFEYLSKIHVTMAQHLRVSAVAEGTVVFPKEPLITIEGPLGIGHLLETTLLNLVNFPSLIATNASRMVLRAAPIPCIEFGLRRAQGPDGALSASKYSYVGGFVATSNVQAGKIFGIPIAGTHAHSYVQSFSSLDEAAGLTLVNKTTQTKEVFLDAVLEHRKRQHCTTTNDGELAAFVAYACAFPNACLCLVDTYDTLHSGIPNFVCVAKTLDDFGYVPKGVRLDSGDLVALSKGCKAAFDRVVASEPLRTAAFRNLTIVASNDINEATLQGFQLAQQHCLTAFGIGTNLVTCQAQPALGCVYKLVEYKGEPRIKLSEELNKVTLPGRKNIYRLYGKPDKDDTNGNPRPLLDYMTLADEDPPQDGDESILCRDPFRHQHRLRVFPIAAIPLNSVVYESGRVVIAANTTGLYKDDVVPSYLSRTQKYVTKQLSEEFHESVTRYKDLDPIPYDVMVSPKLYDHLHELWEKNAPVPERR